MYSSSKRFGPIATGHRQWRHDGHCKFVHGYGRIVEITFISKELDARGWVMDFGNLKFVKEFLESQWDHKVLLAYDDPLLEDFIALQKAGGINLNIMPKGYGPGIEQSCKYVYDNVNPMVQTITDNKVKIKKVKIFEHENNWAQYNAKSK